jgi:hypothetical protein
MQSKLPRQKITYQAIVNHCTDKRTDDLNRETAPRTEFSVLAQLQAVNETNCLGLGIGAEEHKVLSCFSGSF